jgi:hypothetical protein
MPDMLSGPRCSGTRRLRWAALVVAAAVVLTGSFGTTGAYAAAGGNSAVHAATASADANHGVGNDNGNGNDKHADASTTTTVTTVTTVTTSADASTSSSPTSSSSASHQVDCTATPSDPLCSKQPLSTADQNTGGANGQCPGGPYCSTRDGSASGNGNRTQGQHTGEPCAGCVGKADNKNPKGQNPDGSDHNAGYECDRNHGIGRTNPAHTGCKPTPPPTVCTAPNTMVNGVCTPPTVCTAPNTMVNGVCTPPTVCTAPNTMVNGVCTPPATDCTTNPTAAGCQHETGGGDCTNTPDAASCDNSGGGTVCTPTQANGFCSTVLGEKVTRKPAVQGEKLVNAPSSLPFTGANVAALLLAAVAGLTTGTALLVAGRRRRTQ